MTRSIRNPRRTDLAPKRLATIAEAAEQARCNSRTIRRRISDGSLVGYRMGPRLIRVDLNELEALLRPIPTAGDGALSRGRYGTVQAESARVQNRTRAPDVDRLTGVCTPKADAEAAAG